MISIIMPVKDNLDYTVNALQTLNNCTYSEFELIIIDDGSKEDTQKFINEIPFERKIVYKINEWKGLSYAWNKGIKLSNCKYICLVNNDVLFTDGWDIPLIKALDEGAWIASPYITTHEIPWDFPKGGYRVSNPYTKEIEGSCFIVPYWIYFNEIGLFPEELTIFCGDVWLIEEIKKKNGVYKMVKESYIHHFLNTTCNQIDSDKKIRDENVKTYLERYFKS
jgi:glycosyltransferase involved in cell wall biosynthesis